MMVTFLVGGGAVLFAQDSCLALFGVDGLVSWGLVGKAAEKRGSTIDEEVDVY
jgi:hypothetical protein